MDLFTIAAACVIAIVALSIAAFVRSGGARRDVADLQTAVDALTERLESLEREAKQARRARAAEAARTVAPMVAPAAPQARPIEPAIVQPIVEPAIAQPIIEPAIPKPIVDAAAPSQRSTAQVPELPTTPDDDEPVASDAYRPPEQAPNAVLAWLLRGNPLAKLGVVLLFFGLAYLLKFATDRGMLSIELRLAGAAVIAMGLLVVGWRLRSRTPVYALTLQGGAIGALYLTCFAAFRVYGLLPYAAVFALLLVICAASVVLAVLQRAQSLAIMASLGGYLAPILLSTGEGNHLALFGYYALLSSGILAISVWQAWRPLNLIGFFFTFGVGLTWGAARYQPSLYAGCQGFLLLNLAIYGVLAVLTAFRHGDARTDALVDGTLVFGTPLVGFGMQVAITNHWRYGPAFSAVGFSAVYLPLAWWTMQRWRERGRRVTASFLALGAGFGTLAIPLALSARWTSMAWALEGLGVLWAGRTQRVSRMVWSGTGLLLLAGAAALIAWLDGGMNTPTFLMVSATVALTWLGGSWLWRTGDDEDSFGSAAGKALFAGGIVAWCSFDVEAARAISGVEHMNPAVLLPMSASAFAWDYFGRRWSWRALERAAFLLWPVSAIALLLTWAWPSHPFGAGAWGTAWPVAFVTGWHLLRRAHSTPGERLTPVLGVASCWIVFACAALEVDWRLSWQVWGAEEWRFAGLLALSAAAIGGVGQLVRMRHWSVVAHPTAYQFWGLLPPLALGVVLLMTANLLDGRVPGYPYVPFINPTEEAAAFALLAAIVWRRQLAGLVSDEFRAALRFAVILLVIWWGNGMVLRTIAAVAGVSWQQDALWRSATIQTTMALVWTVAALVSMAIAARRASRGPWFAGAAGLAVVVVKLFLVDSARGGGLARAVSFIGVALLVLLIGYLAPLPPRSEQEKGVAS